jgi:hypothetical protein
MYCIRTFTNKGIKSKRDHENHNHNDARSTTVLMRSLISPLEFSVSEVDSCAPAVICLLYEVFESYLTLMLCPKTRTDSHPRYFDARKVLLPDITQ